MSEQIVIIGKMIDESNGHLHLAYPSTTGIREIRIPEDAVERRERITHGRVALLVADTGEFSTQLHLSGRNSPYHVTEEHIRIVCNMENGDDLDEEDYDDEVPVMHQGDAPTVVITGQHGIAPVVSDGEVWGQGMFAGGRRASETDWRFKPVKRPAFVFLNDEGQDGMESTMASVADASGTPSAYHIFNPTYASPKRPMGALLGTFGPGYYPLAYEVGFDPILQKATEFGWKASVTAYNEGKRARLDCDVSQAGHTKEATADRMRGIGASFDESITTPIVEGLAGLYRYGFTIHNSLDGSSAYKIQATAMRAECANMQMMDAATANLMSLKHTHNSMANYQWGDLSSKVNDTIIAAQQELVNVEVLKNISCSQDLLERIMTLSEKKGIITKPQLARDDSGNVTSINRGHMWKVLGHGMTHPSESWVAVNETNKNTLFHVYNVLSGAITHKPVYNEAGKKPLAGSTLNFGTMDKRLKATHDLLLDVGDKAIKDYTKYTETSSIGVDALADLKDYTLDAEILQSVPLFSEVLY